MRDPAIVELEHKVADLERRVAELEGKKASKQKDDRQ